MNTAIEMHDSECLAIETSASSQGSVLFEAYVHRTDGIPGRASGEGGVQHIRMKIDHMTIEGEVGKLPADIYEGSLIVGLSVQNNMIPFPAAYSEPVCLTMGFSGDARIVTIRGSAISIEPENEFKFVELFESSH